MKIQIGSQFEYLPAYTAASGREGRFEIVREIRPDFWETRELLAGYARNYFETDIFQCSRELPAAVGQLWASVNGAATVIRLTECQVSAYVPAPTDPASWLWSYEEQGTNAPGMLAEDLLLLWYARVDGLTEAGRKRTPANGRCPCGSPAFIMGRTVECERSGCRNFV